MDIHPQQNPIGPYRVFFPLGCAFAVWGASLWPAFDRGLVLYPGPTHADIMVGGFLLSFAVGFLLTAVPRFTGTSRVSGREMWLIGFPLALEAISEAGLFGSTRRPVIDHIAIACTLVLLLACLVRRYVRRVKDPPPTFPIAGLGVAIGALGAVLWSTGDMTGSDEVLAVGRSLLLHGFMPALVLGIGGRLIPLLNGRLDTPASPQDVRSARGQALLAAIVFIAGLLIETLFSTVLGRLLQALAVTFVALRFWTVHRIPPRKGIQSFCIWGSSWSFLLGYWGRFFCGAGDYPQYGIHVLHLTFIGGMGLLTLAIATRVLLSHGGHDLAAEFTSRALLGAACLVTLAMLARILAGAAEQDYFHVLSLAALLWVSGIVLWSARFLKAAVSVRN